MEPTLLIHSTIALREPLLFRMSFDLLRMTAFSLFLCLQDGPLEQSLTKLKMDCCACESAKTTLLNWNPKRYTCKHVWQHWKVNHHVSMSMSASRRLQNTFSHI